MTAAPPDEAELRVLRAFLLAHCAPPRPATPPPAAQSGPPAGRALWAQEVDCMRLLAAAPAVGARLFTDPLAALAALRAAGEALCRAAGVPAADLSLRPTHVPGCGGPPPALPPARGVLVRVSGSVVRLGARRVVPFVHRLRCPHCRESAEVPSSPFDRGARVAAACGNAACRGAAMESVGQVWMDHAECCLQQRTGLAGRLPRTLRITLDDELTAACAVGQHVEVVGVLFPRWRAARANARPLVEPTVWALNVTPMDAHRGQSAAPRRRATAADGPAFSPDAFFASFCKARLRRGAALAASLCPQLSGLFAPRMAVLLAAVGGADVGARARMHVRATIHCLFVGDPSTGKSQLLRSAAVLAPRSASTTGIGSTSAGLTVAAAREAGEWVLEPGALVLSDGGVCVIDELRTVSPADRASLHEAMEQQTISVAKAGMVTRLRTACSVVSACNPPERRAAHGTEIGVGGPLLSRFDFIFLLWDTHAPAADAAIAAHILACARAERLPAATAAQEDVAQYVRWVRAHYAATDGPRLSDRAADLLRAYYDMQQRRGASPSLADCVPVTIRLLESLVRITQAHAKLHLEPVCGEEDAAMAVFLLEQSAYSLKCPLEALGPGVFTSSKSLEEAFLDDSAEGAQQQRRVLRAIADVFACCNTDSNNNNNNSSSGSQLLEEVSVPSQSSGRHKRSRDSVENSKGEGRGIDECAEGERRKTMARDLDDPAVRSARRLERDVCTPLSNPQTVLQYSPDADTRGPQPQVVAEQEPQPAPQSQRQKRRDAEEIMRSLSFHF